MTAILAIFANDGTAADEALVTRMLGRMASRGGARASVWREGGVVIAISRHEWEFGPGFSGPVLIVQDGDHVIAADASLYYRDDLRRKLAAKGIRAKGDTPSHLILAAYQAFGVSCPEMLEGDFSFVIWDRKKRQIIAARDFAGKRPLYYARLRNNTTLVIASSLAGVLEHSACPWALNLFVIGGTAANLWAAHNETCYEAISVLPAAHTLTTESDSSTSIRLARHWTPPVFESGSQIGFNAAAEQLQDLLRSATAERLAQVGNTSIWLSGGADSPAVFATGQKALAEANDGRLLLPVSVSYPVGDQGREDEIIKVIADRWNAPIHWLDSSTIAILDRPMQRAANRDEPFAHSFEMLVRTLSDGSRSVGTRVALDGNGGDQLFYASDYYLSDLFRAGALRTLRSQWRMKHLRGISTFWSLAVQPQLPNSVKSAAKSLGLTRAVSSVFDRALPDWIDRNFAKRQGLMERESNGSRKNPGETCSAFEGRWFFTQAYAGKVGSLVSQFALESGVESRSPLYDARVIAFAATRPRWERASGRRTKQLLNHSMKGLLPESVLAPRPFKTGLTGNLFDRGLREWLPTLSANLLDPACHLASLGVVIPSQMRKAVKEYEITHDGVLGLALLLTLQTELWLRSHSFDTHAEVNRRTTAVRLPAKATNAA